MGKTKKQRKGAKGDESGSEVEVDTQELIEKANAKKPKPKKKQGRWR